MLATLAFSALAAAKAPATGPAAVDAVVRFEAPKGWTRSDYANSAGADPVVAFENGADAIRVSVYGAPGSSYKTPEEFLAGPAATTMGRPPEKAGSVKVAGTTTTLFSRGSPRPNGDSHVVSALPVPMGKELFCLLPALPDGRFAVLSWERRTPVPDRDGRGEKAWRSLLKSTRRPMVPKP